MGDLVHCFPVVSYLREKFPEGEIDWVVEAPFAPLVEAHPWVDRVYRVETKKWRKAPSKTSTWKEVGTFRKELRKKQYDVVFDLQGNTKSGLFTFCARGKEKAGFSWRGVAEWPNGLFTGKKYLPPKGKNIREDYLSIVQAFFGDNGSHRQSPVALKVSPEEKKRIDEVFANTKGPVVLVSPGSVWPNKCLPLPLLQEVLEKMGEQTFFLFAWGNEKERVVAAELEKVFAKRAKLLPRFSLPALQQVMERCERVVAMDSLPLHLAATTNTPTSSFFGPSLASKYAPIGKEHTAFQGECPYGMVFDKRCPKLRTCPTGACMEKSALISLRGPEVEVFLDK
ncbi:MAG: Lipopolysaccharide heptosyltransferase 1 [Chlamydiae bacterium]|nr:Lipopolysaccharide heptosyltransferase 1 [Chlamydiota bacterium]